MKITVIGAGAIGAALARELSAHEGVAQVQVCDTRARSLRALHERVDAPTLRSFQLDVRDTNVLMPLLRGSDCVISCVPSELNPDLARLAVEMGAHFCDLGGNDAIVEQEMALAEDARSRSVWIVPNCGLAPGLVNILCLHGMAQFDRVEAAHLRVGDVPLKPKDPFRFRISWSAERVVEDYTNPARFIEGGQVVEADALSRDETICFASPFDCMEAFCTQGGLSTLTDQLAGRLDSLDHKTIRWPGHVHQMRFVMGLGLGEASKVDVRTHLTYRDLLVRRLRDRLGGDYEDAVLLRVLLRGQKDGRAQTLVYEMVERYDEARGMTAMMRCTSIPTAVIATLVAGPEVTGGGADVPENIIPHDAFLDGIRARGLDIQTIWHEGHVEVTALEPLGEVTRNTVPSQSESL
jgi:saccharopine dehydrogenase-like NADP-dependent oxidoreductase